ncbi:hypothetical protein LCGC14_1608720 [marine sediment metagenome]|uniref:HTH cro/C1-type domain-containing protein n=1 Tax=marine sediment metagenome TaxID=412755 RepID=A0A0F9I9C5_9ZZZZ
MFFGEKLRKARLKQKFGLRRFADKIRMKPSAYSNVEHGYIKPPGTPDDCIWICDIIKHLELEKYDPAIMKLMISWGQPFIMQKMTEFGCPIFVHHEDGTPFSEEELSHLYKDFEVTREEHNRKAVKDNEKKKNM